MTKKIKQVAYLNVFMLYILKFKKEILIEARFTENLKKMWRELYLAVLEITFVIGLRCRAVDSLESL